MPLPFDSFGRLPTFPSVTRAEQNTAPVHSSIRSFAGRKVSLASAQVDVSTLIGLFDEGIKNRINSSYTTKEKFVPAQGSVRNLIGLFDKEIKNRINSSYTANEKNEINSSYTANEKNEKNENFLRLNSSIQEKEFATKKVWGDLLGNLPPKPKSSAEFVTESEYNQLHEAFVNVDVFDKWILKGTHYAPEIDAQVIAEKILDGSPELARVVHGISKEILGRFIDEKNWRFSQDKNNTKKENKKEKKLKTEIELILTEHIIDVCANAKDIKFNKLSELLKNASKEWIEQRIDEGITNEEIFKLQLWRGQKDSLQGEHFYAMAMKLDDITKLPSDADLDKAARTWEMVPEADCKAVTNAAKNTNFKLSHLELIIKQWPGSVCHGEFLPTASDPNFNPANFKQIVEKLSNKVDISGGAAMISILRAACNLDFNRHNFEKIVSKLPRANTSSEPDQIHASDILKAASSKIFDQEYLDDLIEEFSEINLKYLLVAATTKNFNREKFATDLKDDPVEPKAILNRITERKREFLG